MNERSYMDATNETIDALKARITKLERENAELRFELRDIRTRIDCRVCGNGVAVCYAVHGLCQECAAKRIDELRNQIAYLEQHVTRPSRRAGVRR